MAELEERELVRRCLAGEEPAHRQFVERYQGLVYGVCVRMLGDRHEAEGVAQETFLRALRSLGRWDATRPIRGWLLAIAANRCRTQLGRRSRRPAANPFAEEIPDHRPDTKDANELADEIRWAISQLRPDYSQVVLLYHEEGLSYEEMSEVTGRPVGTLKTWLHRARAELLEHLRKKGLAPEAKHDLTEV